MSRDSVAVLLWLLWHHQGGSSDIGQPIRAMLGMGQHDHLTDAQVAEARRIEAALTREAAPQASGGEVVAELNAALGAVFAEDPAAAVRAHAAVSPIIRRLATTDSAHPQAAGSAPVGAEDLAERLTDLLRQEMPSESIIYRCVEMALAAMPAIDAALEKERAE